VYKIGIPYVTSNSSRQQQPYIGYHIGYHIDYHIGYNIGYHIEYHIGYHIHYPVLLGTAAAASSRIFSLIYKVEKIYNVKKGIGLCLTFYFN
jgi:hypothetical protein